MSNNFYQSENNSKGLFGNKSYTNPGETPQGKIDNKIIAENERYFNTSIKLPKILSVIFFVLCAITGIAIAVEEGFWVFLVFVIGGLVVSLIMYHLTRIAFSTTILQTLYLKKISNGIEILNSNNSGASKQENELPLI